MNALLILAILLLSPAFAGGLSEEIQDETHVTSASESPAKELIQEALSKKSNFSQRVVLAAILMSQEETAKEFVQETAKLIQQKLNFQKFRTQESGAAEVKRAYHELNDLVRILSYAMHIQKISYETLQALAQLNVDAFRTLSLQSSGQALYRYGAWFEFSAASLAHLAGVIRTFSLHQKDVSTMDFTYPTVSVRIDGKEMLFTEGLDLCKAELIKKDANIFDNMNDYTFSGKDLQHPEISATGRGRLLVLKKSLIESLRSEGRIPHAR